MTQKPKRDKKSAAQMAWSFETFSGFVLSSHPTSFTNKLQTKPKRNFKFSALNSWFRSGISECFVASAWNSQQCNQFLSIIRKQQKVLFMPCSNYRSFKFHVLSSAVFTSSSTLVYFVLLLLSPGSRIVLSYMHQTLRSSSETWDEEETMCTTRYGGSGSQRHKKAARTM